MIVENVKKVDELLWGYEEPLLVGATMVLPPEEVKVIVGDDFDEDGDDDDDGLPAYSHHDKIPPWWGNVSNDEGGNVSVSNSHHS